MDEGYEVAAGQPVSEASQARDTAAVDDDTGDQGCLVGGHAAYGDVRGGDYRVPVGVLKWQQVDVELQGEGLAILHPAAGDLQRLGEGPDVPGELPARRGVTEVEGMPQRSAGRG